MTKSTMLLSIYTSLNMTSSESRHLSGEFKIIMNLVTLEPKGKIVFIGDLHGEDFTLKKFFKNILLVIINMYRSETMLIEGLIVKRQQI